MTLPTPDTDIVTLAKRFRKALEREEAAALERLINSYGLIYERVQDKVDLLLAQMADGQVTGSAVKRLERYKDLMQLINRELSRYQEYAGMEMQTVARNAVEVGIKDARSLAWSDPMVISTGWNNINPRVVEELTAFLDTAGPLYKRLSKLAPTVADKVSETIIRGIGLGDNPKTTARIITNSFGIGLDDSMRMMRTVQIYSHREANRASYLANSDVVEGWYWMSALDADSCCSCIAMHGTFHTNDETLDDHHNGLCTMLPATIGTKNPLSPGEEWFNNLPEDKQRAYMGNTKYDAWKGGKFEFSALSSTHEDEVYGTMRGETPLKDLIGESSE